METDEDTERVPRIEDGFALLNAAGLMCAE
jgi:hypothetical protein